MRSFALLLLATPLAAAPLLTLDHGSCTCEPSREQLQAEPSQPAAFDADAFLRSLAREVDWIATRNAWRQRRADTRARVRAQRRADPRAGTGPFGFSWGRGPVAESPGAPEPSAPASAEPVRAAGWFQSLPIDPATPGYAYTGAAGQRVGYRQHPVHGGRRFHTGVDLGVAGGTPIHAIGAGRVVQAGQGGGFGHWLVLEHAGGVRSFYAHMATPAKVRAGAVEAGQVVGFVGSTGTSTAPHLHFEVWMPRQDLPAYAREWISRGDYPLDEAHMPGLGLIDPTRVADFTRSGGTPSGEGAVAAPAAD